MILSTADVKCFGRNDPGALGYGDVTQRGSDPSEMGTNLPAIDLGGGTPAAITAGESHTCVLFDDGTAKCWGYNSQGQLGVGDTVQRGDGPDQMGANLVAIDFGAGLTAHTLAGTEHHTCAILAHATNDDILKCWGRNDYGQCGTGDLTNIGDGGENGGMGDNLPAIDLVSATA